MAFLLADSFQASLDKLGGDDQKAAKLAAFELRINPAKPGLQCHRLGIRGGPARLNQPAWELLPIAEAAGTPLSL